MPQYCTFRLEGHLFGVPVAGVQEVLRAQELTSVPLAPTEVAGLINLRGQIVTALDLRSRLRLDPLEPGRSQVFVVVRTADGHAVSLVVDQIGDVLDPSTDAFEPPPETVPSELRPLLTGVCKLADELMLALDIELAVDLGGEAA